MDKIKKLGFLLLYAVLILLAVRFLYSYMHTSADRVFLTPQFENNKGWNIYTIRDGKRNKLTVQELYNSTGETVYLSKVLDKKLENSGYTILELDSLSFQQSVFLDDKLLYTINPNADNRIGHVKFPKKYKGLPGIGEYVRLSLPPGYGGKMLTIAVSYNTAVEYRSLPMIRLSSESILTQLLVSDSNRISMPAAAYMTIAVLLLGMFFYNLYYAKASFSILMLMLAALLQAFRTLLDFEFYFSSHFSLNIIFIELLIPLAYGLPMLYMFTQMRRWKKWYAPFLLVPLILSLLLHILSKFPVFAVISSCQYDCVLYIPLLALCIFSVMEWRDQNKIYRLFTPGFFAVIAGFAFAFLVFTLSRNDSVLVSIVQHPITFLNLALQYIGITMLLLAGCISFFLTVKKTADTQSELAVMSVKNQLMLENIQSIQENSTQIAVMRHDMLRHLHTMLDLSHGNEKERLENYLEELTKETESILPIRICRHPTINALVTRALSKAKKENIQIDTYVEVPADISIKDSDLCTLLMNMLDNAVEAVSVLPKEKKRRIELTMHVRGRYLFIETANSYNGNVLINQETGLFKSTKGAGHGYGIKAMSDIAKKYMSKLQIKQEADTFIVRTALLMPETKD
ncbi:sensor histidine kinase [Anaerostipes sp.]|uniref:sensor histidine kinase n=1 Tax=Anaerostipes sp. TaxID=1872530 RepID=UPI0025B9EDEF|nr:GHKL domain-containing protein [Anaerostipes sp.]MBS7009473.1 sensor histidine kinase [Anaerostipes sp.]